MVYLFAQKINPFQQCTICSITCGLLFLKEKWTQASPVSLWGPTVEADSLRSERKEPSSSPICCRSPRGDKQCWFWHSLPVPTNKSCLFFPKHVGSGSCWRTGNEEQDEGKQERGKKQPWGWRNILYACALKHKVCGQLLKDFSGESRLSTESIEKEREKRIVLYNYVRDSFLLEK